MKAEERRHTSLTDAPDEQQQKKRRHKHTHGEIILGLSSGFFEIQNDLFV